jgi:hypothetical protein
MLQRSVVERWIGSEHILLIHQLRKIFLLSLRVTKVSERMHEFLGMLSLFYVVKVSQHVGRRLHRLAVLC